MTAVMTDAETEDRQTSKTTLRTLSEALSSEHLADDAAARFSRQKWKLVADTGLFAIATDPQQRADEPLLTSLSALEELGYGCRDSGLSFSAASHLASTGVSLAQFGSTELQDRYLPAVRAGEAVGAHAITEQEAGSDAMSMRTTAIRDGDEYVLNGHKAFVSNGPIADLLVVYARTGKPGTAASITAFLIERNAPGLLVGEPVETMGLRTCPMGELRLVDVRLPRSHVVGHPGGGVLVLNYVMAREILSVAAIQIGEMQHRLEQCVNRTQQRVQFGKPIGAFQAVAHMVVEMKIGLETARRWLDDTARRIAAREDATAEVAITKLVTSEANVASARHALQIFGGSGFLTRTGVERGLRDALAGTIYSGTSEIQKNRVAALIGVPGG